MYNCIVRVLHQSPHGQSYTRVHIVPVSGTLDDAVRLCGAIPPEGANPCLSLHRGASEIEYTDEKLPVCEDPAAIVLLFEGLPSGIYIHVPYQCSYENLIHDVIPRRLRQFGLHAFDVYGDLEGKLTDVFNNGLTPKLWWTKLRKRVRFSWPPHVIQGIRLFQKLYRNWLEQKEWIVLEQGLEPWTNSS